MIYASAMESDHKIPGCFIDGINLGELNYLSHLVTRDPHQY